jgi:hypothetical protein
VLQSAKAITTTKQGNELLLSSLEHEHWATNNMTLSQYWLH